MSIAHRVLLGAHWLWSGVLALLICAPLLLSRGFALTHDMVFVPREPWKGGWLGLDGSVPRAVPSDALVSALTSVVPGDLVQKVTLVGLLLLAGAGAAAVVPMSGLCGRLAASTLYVWNPFVYERLAMGQWALLCGYAALPWVAVAAGRIRDGRTEGWPLAALALAAAAFTSPTGGALAGIVCCCLLVGRQPGRTVGALALSLVLNLPWVVPSVLYRGGIPSDASGVSAFAARPDTPYGVVGSLLSLGGIWNREVVPPGRDSWVLAGILLMLSIAALGGLLLVRRSGWAVAVPRLVLVGAVGLGLAVLPALRGGVSVMQWVDGSVPGAGLLRDSQKWVALLALAESVGLATLVAVLGRRLQGYGRTAAWWLLAGSVLAPMAATVSLAWGLGGRLQPVSYPRDWSTVAVLLDGLEAQGTHGDVAVLPWSTYRQYGWNDERPVLDPAPRFLPGDVVIADTLVVGNHAVRGEDAQAAEIGSVLARGGDVTSGLRRQGVGLVVVERGTPGVGRGVTLDGDLVFDSDQLQLWVLPHPGAGPASPSFASQAATVVGDVLAGATVIGSLGLVARDRLRRYTRR